jgi:hypothetical protein
MKYASLLVAVPLTLGCAATNDAPGSSDGEHASSKSTSDGAGANGPSGAGGASGTGTASGGAPLTTSSTSSNGTGGGAGGGDCTNPLDQSGCSCPTAGATRACYTGPAGSENVGTCKDGTQTCVADGEFATWSACAGDVLPSSEDCANHRDTNCNGAVGCDDSACTGMTGCCMVGDTRPCYTGPGGTAGVGQCKSGQQACVSGGAWGACMGEVLPGNEQGHCGDGIDNDCNGHTDCDQFVCQLDPACHMVCTAGDTRACYTGPAGTEGVGPCAGGTQTCNSGGTGWGDCTGQTLPAQEGGRCTDGVDNDCNGKIDCADLACASASACCTSDPNPPDGTIWANSDDTLYRVDPSSLTTTRVGGFAISDQMTDVAVTPDGRLYGVSFTSLYSINKVTGAATFIASVPGNGNNSLTFLASGDLLAADGGGNLKRIDPSTGQVTPIGSYGDGLASAGDLVGVKSGVMYGTSSTTPGGGSASSNNHLIRVDPTTGVATDVGPTGFADVWGLAYSGAHVIGFTTSGAIIRIDPQTGAGASVGQQSVVFWGAGQSPLVADDACP